MRDQINTREPEPTQAALCEGRAAMTGAVDPKSTRPGKFGNDSIGFIRVRRRRLKFGGTSANYDIVRAVRVNGKPRHQFVLGLGSQKSWEAGRVAALLLIIAVGRMRDHGLNESQRRALLSELIRKGARLPTIADCESWKHDKSWAPHADDVIGWLRAAP